MTKIVKAIKKTVKKVAKKEPIVEEIEIVEVTACESCNGRGLIDALTLCADCAGSGQK